ncbi:hypothetical protein E2562_000326 [Oryza meyeriana var. granulata]|uniref:Uncharacterized protein n=1 Tax=Oryza meyeriana var. granulata TaxID=110450 RepID=A0A6G1CLB0_9ORYZ|nr:hypothetical protein E2562_000326 [Oryza meyeriana var. granulata]
MRIDGSTRAFVSTGIGSSTREAMQLDTTVTSGGGEPREVTAEKGREAEHNGLKASGLRG